MRFSRMLIPDFKVVEADSGAIGGAGSKEFMVLADSGEDTIMVCDSCDFGANLEVIAEDEKICPKCSGELSQTKGIEAGHIFQLGTTYSEAMKAEFVTRDGLEKEEMALENLVDTIMEKLV